MIIIKFDESKIIVLCFASVNGRLLGFSLVPLVANLVPHYVALDVLCMREITDPHSHQPTHSSNTAQHASCLSRDMCKMENCGGKPCWKVKTSRLRKGVIEFKMLI